MFFTNKEKETLQQTIKELEYKNKLQIDTHKIDMLSVGTELEENYYRLLEQKKKDWMAEDMGLEQRYRIEATKAMKLETENSILRAQLEVLTKLENNEDAHKEVIKKLELELATKTLELQGTISELKSLNEHKQKTIEEYKEEITELKLERKDLIKNIFACTTKDPLVIKQDTPLIVQPMIVEPTILSSKK